MPLGRSNTIRNDHRKSALLSPQRIPSGGSPRFLPPSHYAAAAGISYNHKSPKSPQQYAQDPEPTTTQDNHVNGQSESVETYIPTVYQSDSSNSSFEYRPAAGSQFSSAFTVRSSSQESERSTSASSTTESQSAHTTPKSKRRQSQIPNLPMLEASLLPSLRDTVDRMTKPSSSSPSPGSGQSATTSNPDSRNSRRNSIYTGTTSPSRHAISTGSYFPDPRHPPAPSSRNPRATFTSDHSQSQAPNAGATSGDTFASTTPRTTTPSLRTPKPALKSLLKVATPKMCKSPSNRSPQPGDGRDRDYLNPAMNVPLQAHPQSHSQWNDDSEPVAKLASRRSSSRNGSHNKENLHENVSRAPKGTNTSRRPRDRSCTDPGPIGVQLSDHARYAVPPPKPPSTPQPGTSSTGKHNAGFVSSLPRRSRSNSRPPPPTQMQTPKVLPPSQTPHLSDSDSEYGSQAEDEKLHEALIRKTQKRQTLIITNADITPSTSSSSAASSEVGPKTPNRDASTSAKESSSLRKSRPPGAGAQIPGGGDRASQIPSRQPHRHGLGFSNLDTGEVKQEQQSSGSSSQPRRGGNSTGRLQLQDRLRATINADSHTGSRLPVPSPNSASPVSSPHPAEHRHQMQSNAFGSLVDYPDSIQSQDTGYSAVDSSGYGYETLKSFDSRDHSSEVHGNYAQSRSPSLAPTPQNSRHRRLSMYGDGGGGGDSGQGRQQHQRHRAFSEAHQMENQPLLQPGSPQVQSQMHQQHQETSQNNRRDSQVQAPQASKNPLSMRRRSYFNSAGPPPSSGSSNPSTTTGTAEEMKPSTSRRQSRVYSPQPPPSVVTPHDDVDSRHSRRQSVYYSQSQQPPPLNKRYSSHFSDTAPTSSSPQRDASSRSSLSLASASSLATSSTNTSARPHSPYVSDEIRRRRQVALEGIVSGLNLDSSESYASEHHLDAISPAPPKIFSSKGMRESVYSEGSVYFGEEGVAVTDGVDGYDSEGVAQGSNEFEYGYDGEAHYDVDETYGNREYGNDEYDPNLSSKRNRRNSGKSSSSRTPNKTRYAHQPHEEEEVYLADSVSLARRSSIVAAKERTTWGLPPSQSDIVFHKDGERGDKWAHEKQGRNRNRRMSGSGFESEMSSESSVGSVYWDDDEDGGENVGEKSLSQGAQSLFRKLSNREMKRDSSASSSSTRPATERQRQRRYSEYSTPQPQPTIDLEEPGCGQELSPSSSRYTEDQDQDMRTSLECATLHTGGKSSPTSFQSGEVPRSDDGQSLNEMDIHRHRVIWELCDSEAYFVSQLQDTIQLFVLPLRIQKSKTWISGVPLAITKLLDWFEDISNLHRDLLDVLKDPEKGSRREDEMLMIAEEMRDFARRLEVYQPYLVEMPGVLEVIKGMVDGDEVQVQRQDSEAKNFGQFIRMQQDAMGCNLQDMLIRPVNRLSQYPEIFRKLLSCTSKDHPDYVTTVCLVRSVEVVIRAMTEVKVREDEYQYLKAVVERIEGFRTYTAQVMTRERKLLAQGRVYLGSENAAVFASSAPRDAGHNTRNGRLMDAIRGRQQQQQDAASFSSQSAMSCWTVDNGSIISGTGERSVREAQTFVFSDMIILADVVQMDNGEAQWILMEDVGISRVLGIESSLYSGDTDFTLDLLPYGMKGDDRLSSCVHSLLLRIPECKSEDQPGLGREDWLDAFRRCSNGCIRALSLPLFSIEEESEEAALSSILKAGLPFPKSPSIQVEEHRGLVDAGHHAIAFSAAQDGKRSEREARGWWAVRLRSVLREFRDRELG